MRSDEIYKKNDELIKGKHRFNFKREFMENV